MPKCTTFTEFIEQRYNRTTSKVFFLFGVGVIIYVLVAQAVGIGIVFNSMFGIPYEIGAAVPIAIVTVYISKAGLRGSIFNDVIQFFIIHHPDHFRSSYFKKHWALMGSTMDWWMLSTIRTIQTTIQVPFPLGSSAGFRYGLTAVVVAMGQVLLGSRILLKSYRNCKLKVPVPRLHHRNSSGMDADSDHLRQRIRRRNIIFRRKISPSILKLLHSL